MELTRAALEALFTGLNMSLNKGLTKSWTAYTTFANVTASSNAAEKYPIAIITGSMRKWIGMRVLNRLSGKSMTIHNEDYERTEAVRRNDIADDNIGYYSGLFEAMGIDAGNLWPVLATRALAAAGKWADNAAFFSATRKIGKSTINNIVNDALSATSYETARGQMMGFAGADGNPIGLIPDHIMVGPTLEKTANRLFKSSLIAEDGVAVDNPHKDECKVLVNPFLIGDDAAKWFLLCTSRGIQAVTVQKRQEGALQRWDQDHDVNVKNDNENHYGLHYRGAAAATCPYVVIGGNLG